MKAKKTEQIRSKEDSGNKIKTAERPHLDHIERRMEKLEFAAADEKRRTRFNKNLAILSLIVSVAALVPASTQTIMMLRDSFHKRPHLITQAIHLTNIPEVGKPLYVEGYLSNEGDEFASDVISFSRADVIQDADFRHPKFDFYDPTSPGDVGGQREAPLAPHQPLVLKWKYVQQLSEV